MGRFGCSLSLLSLLAVVNSFRLVPRYGHAKMIMSGGDLRDGLDPERNAILQSLKKSFYSSSSDRDDDTAASALEGGFAPDLPLCRWSFNILPHQRAALNVFQPQYTLLFEKLLTTERPWLYAHVLLPGGVENLANPAYRLEPGSDAPLQGTIMEVVAVQREADSRLSLLVQGVARGIVLRPTQALPYARADVMLLPDDEQLLECALMSRRYLLSSSGAYESCFEGASDPEQQQRRIVMAAAAAGDRHWKAYEHANV